MMRRVLAGVLATSFLAFAPPLMAQEPNQEKPLTAQQQKMKDCAVKWKDEKAKTNAKGREAYGKFMSGCLKT